MHWTYLYFAFHLCFTISISATLFTYIHNIVLFTAFFTLTKEVMFQLAFVAVVYLLVYLLIISITFQEELEMMPKKHLISPDLDFWFKDFYEIGVPTFSHYCEVTNN